MFREIKIETYRGLKEVQLYDLRQINVIIGENNSGKTSVLEAIQMFDNSDVLSNVVSIAQKRETQLSAFGRNRLVPFDMFLYSFPMQDEYRKEIELEAYDERYGECRVGIRGKLHRDVFYEEDLQPSEVKRYETYCDEAGSIRIMQGEYIFERKNREGGDFLFRETQLKPERKEKSSGNAPHVRHRDILYISPLDIYTNKIISASLYKGMLVEEKQRLLDLMRLFDERIIGIETAVNHGTPVTMIELDGCGLVPVSVFGDGLKKILTLASAVVKMRGGVLLIDEFETGIHKRALMQVAKWLAAVTERYEVQVFLTTHSSDAIEALVEAQDSHNSIKAYRIEHYRNSIYVKEFAGGDIYMLKNSQGLDIL